MKLLILTQRVDLNDPVLGFFHGWVKEFSKRFDKVTVICLGKGEYRLPGDVKVLSLGKEEGVSGFVYLFRFYRYIWRERKNYDAVFVHMNQEYILLGALFWRSMGKRVMMWRNHPAGSFLTDIAVFLSDKVFCTSTFSYTAKFRKTTIMPVGIDAGIFERKPAISKMTNSVLFLGRIAPVKRPDLFIEALNVLKKGGEEFSALVVGDPLPKDEVYYKSLVAKTEEYGLLGKVKFVEGVKNEDAVDLYNKYEVFVNLSPSGSLDKTIFEAMACGAFSVASNKNLIGVVDKKFIFEENDASDLAEKLKAIFALSDEQKNSYRLENRDFVIGNHSLASLVNKVKSFC